MIQYGIGEDASVFFTAGTLKLGLNEDTCFLLLAC